MWSYCSPVSISATIFASISSGFIVEIAWFDTLLISVRARDFFCSAEKRRALSIATVASLASTRSSSTCPSSNTRSCWLFTASMPIDRSYKISGTAHTDPTSCRISIPMRASSFAKFSRIKSGCPVRTTYSGRNFPAARVRFGIRLPSSTSIS